MSFLQISPDDDHSKHICFDCCEKVDKHYDFKQSVLAHLREKINETKPSPLFEISKSEETEAAIISKPHGDMVYACPNCNIDLMIVIRSSPENNCVLHMSLAVADEVEKSIKEGNLEASEDTTISFDNICEKRSNVIDDELHDSCTIIINDKEVEENIDETHENSLELSQDSINCGDAYIIFPKENASHQTNGSRKRKFEEDVCEDATKPSESVKLKPKLSNTVCESESELVNCNYEYSFVKIEEHDDVEWDNSKTDHKEDTEIVYVTETEKEHVDENGTKCADVDVRICPKIVCELCGARYLSQMKYDFHMERHKLDKMDRYVCTVCDKETSNENLLWDHYFYTHKSMVRYVCTMCGKAFAKKPRLKCHQKRHKHVGTKEIHFETDEVDIDREIQEMMTMELQDQLVVNCCLCRKPITDIDPDALNDVATCAACEDSSLSLMVDGSEMKAISPRQYHCSKCSKHFVRKERLEFHEMRHNENMNEFVCSTCGKEFSAENSLYEHYLFVHKGARPHVCELCGKSFQLKTRLKEHLRTHTGERPYQCDLCNQRCMTTNALKLHRKTHFTQNRYTCNICDKSFSKKQNMNEHLEKHWKNDKNVSLPQLFTCPLCGEDLPTYRMLKHHMADVHQIDRQDPLMTQQKPWYECKECHEKFKHQMSLKAHKERVHEGRVSPIFQCDACGAVYKIKQMLINHIRSKHDGEKRYKCAKCGKGFNDTKSLYNHILLHTGRKPFSCDYCNMSFRRKDSRDHHRRKHTGEQPYPCPDCDQSFSTYNNRSKHRKKEHGEGETECPDCGERCNTQQEVRFHLNKHLGEKLNEIQST